MVDDKTLMDIYNLSEYKRTLDRYTEFFNRKHPDIITIYFKIKAIKLKDKLPTIFYICIAGYGTDNSAEIFRISKDRVYKKYTRENTKIIPVCEDYNPEIHFVILDYNRKEYEILSIEQIESGDYETITSKINEQFRNISK